MLPFKEKLTLLIDTYVCTFHPVIVKIGKLVLQDNYHEVVNKSVHCVQVQ